MQACGLIILLLFSTPVFSQGTWTQKMSMTGDARMVGFGFSIGDKGYTGLGISPGVQIVLTDFWEYNSITNSWSQKADFPDGARAGGIGFSIGSKGYVGTGMDGNMQARSDLWEYNPQTNNWIQKANFPGGARENMVCFVINNIAYAGTGDNVNLGTLYDDFWKYNPATDNWTQISNFPGTARTIATAFSLNNKGYVGTGQDFNSNFFQDMWEYSPASNTWIQKNNFGGVGRSEAHSFALGGYGYLGLGTTMTGSGVLADFWKYDPSSDSWTQVSNFGGGFREMVVGFKIACNYYIVSGGENDQNFQNDIWEFAVDSCNEEIENPIIDENPSGSYFLPNVFTPNNDSKNSYWTTNFIDDSEYIVILNRWGQIVAKLSKAAPNWDGTTNSKECDDGVYYYNGVMRGELQQGFIHLMR
jgi:gliding motility-associated-like protein